MAYGFLWVLIYGYGQIPPRSNPLLTIRPAQALGSFRTHQNDGPVAKEFVRCAGRRAALNFLYFLVPRAGLPRCLRPPEVGSGTRGRGGNTSSRARPAGAERVGRQTETSKFAPSPAPDLPNNTNPGSICSKRHWKCVFLFGGKLTLIMARNARRANSHKLLRERSTILVAHFSS